MKKEESIIGKKYTDVFGKKQPTPGFYRTQHKSYKGALVRLSSKEYKTKTSKTRDERSVAWLLKNIKYIEYIAQIRLNVRGVIVAAPPVRVVNQRLVKEV